MVFKLRLLIIFAVAGSRLNAKGKSFSMSYSTALLVNRFPLLTVIRQLLQSCRCRTDFGHPAAFPPVSPDPSAPDHPFRPPCLSRTRTCSGCARAHCLWRASSHRSKYILWDSIRHEPNFTTCIVQEKLIDKNLFASSRLLQTPDGIRRNSNHRPLEPVWR